MKLCAYMARENMTDRAMGNLLRVHRTTAGRYRTRRIIPPWGKMILLLRISGGLVTPNDFLDDVLAELAANRNQTDA